MSRYLATPRTRAIVFITCGHRGKSDPPVAVAVDVDVGVAVGVGVGRYPRVVVVGCGIVASVVRRAPLSVSTAPHRCGGMVLCCAADSCVARAKGSSKMYSVSKVFPAIVRGRVCSC